MKKIKIILAIVLSSTLLCSFGVKASSYYEYLTENEYIEKTKLIKDEIYVLNEKEVSIKSLRLMYDIEKHPTYLLAEFDTGGYAIITRENLNIIICATDEGFNPFTNIGAESKIVFGGPFSYYIIQSDGFHDIISNKIIPFSSINEESIKMNNRIINEQNNTLLEMAYNPKSRVAAYGWSGLPESRFTPMGGWVNTEGWCGTYAAAGLLAYYQDYVNSDFIPSRMRNQYSSNGSGLIQALYLYIDRLYSGTLSPNVSNGINDFLNAYSYTANKHRANYSLAGGTWDFTTNRISNKNRPVIIGTLRILQSSYGDHWVLAYQHRLDSNDNGYYKCVDNWGRSNAEVKASTTRAYVYIDD